MYIYNYTQYCTPEINTSEIIANCQLHFQIDCQWHFPTEFHFCDCWCVICCPESLTVPQKGDPKRGDPTNKSPGSHFHHGPVQGILPTTMA